MEKIDVVNKIIDTNLSQVKTSTLVGWINSIPVMTEKITPNTIKLGDVFMHPVFQHPYVVLNVRGEDDEVEYLCGLLTSNKDCSENIAKCNSRFFSESYITKTLFIVTNKSNDKHKFMGMYDNPRHLKVMLNKLLSIIN